MTGDAVTLRPMVISDHGPLMDLLRGTPGVSLRDADSHEATARYLLRNPGLSFVALQDGALVGCAMAGHDGRRGYLQHVLVVPSHRGQGLARALVERCLAALEGEGILKTHIDVLATNTEAQAFWQHGGWTLRTDIRRYSLVRSGGSNA